MSRQASAQSIDALKDFRVALTLFADDALGALGGVDLEIKRTVSWLQHDRRQYWQDQVKRRRELVALARSEVFRRTLARTDDYTPAMSEQKELLRKAEESLRDAEFRVTLVKKYDAALQRALFEYHGTTRRITTLAGGEVPRAVNLLQRMIDALEAYLNVGTPPAGGEPVPIGTVVTPLLDHDDHDDVDVNTTNVDETTRADAPAAGGPGHLGTEGP